MDVIDLVPASLKKPEQKFMQVPYGCTVHGAAEIAAVVNVLQTSTQMGKHVRDMEKRVAQLVAKKFGVMVNSGSSANYLAVEILNLPAGTEVITPALTFSTTVAPLIKNQLIPAFIDVEPDTFNIDVAAVEAMITPKTRAMMVPNLLGNLPDWQRLRELADHYNLILIEDSADTLGAMSDGELVGRFSDITTTSFYGSHVVNCAGNGGMLCLNDSIQVERATLLRSWGRSSSLYVESEAIENRFNISVDNIPYDAKFVFEAIGYNLEPSEMGAAFGLVQLDSLSENIRRRQQRFQQQLAFFKNYQHWFILPKELPHSSTGWLAYPMIVRDEAPFSRQDMQIYLEKRGIQTRTVFTGNILRQPGFSRIPHKENSIGYANADYVMRGGILLGCHHGLNDAMLHHIHEVFNDFSKLYK
jgi:CDP-6-deoxy-D-xylo-4-hexulose-3-dehydrase